MNIDRLSPLLQRTTLLLSLAAGSFMLAACGGGSDNKSSASSSSLSSSSLRSSFSSASVPANGSGVWPSVKVEAQSTKVLNFAWSAVDGATHYKLYKQDGDNGAVLLADNITTTTASDEIGVHVHDWVNTRYWVDACIADDCSQRSDMAFTATEMIKAIGYFKASNTGSFDWFGWSITLSADGLIMAVGAPAEDSKATGINGDQTNNESVNAGAVYVFVKEDGLWVQQAYLKASNTEQPNLNTGRVLPNDRFGYRVALSDDGNTLAVSALLEDSPSYGINCNQDNYEQITSSASSGGSGDLLTARSLDVGAVYIFTRSEGTWSQDAYVKPIFSTVHAFAQNPVALRFGESLALAGDGKTLAVGTSVDFIGRSGVFNFNNSSSVSSLECLEFYPSSSSSTSSTSSSSSSSSSSSTSSSSSSFLGGSGSGAVYTFRLGENGWQEEAHVKASNAQQNDAFGVSIALSTDGNTMVVGATGEDSQAQGVNGNQADNTCYYINSNSLYVIDPTCKDAVSYVNYGINNGAAYVFNRTDNAWIQEAYLKPSSTFIATQFGASVEVSGDGNTLAIGAKGETNDTVDVSNRDTIDSAKVQQLIGQIGSGSTYVYSRSGTGWAQEARLKPSTITLGGEFGGSVSLSHDGNTLAVGSFRENSYAKGINGDEGDTSMEDAGAVFIFTRNNTVWSQKSYVKAPNTDAGDRFGLNVKLSADGKSMMVGAHRESGKGYTSVAASSGASTSSAASSDGLDQSDNSLEASGAVYLY